MRLFIIVFINILIVFSSQAQTKSKTVSFNEKKINKNKVFENTYHLWWSKYNWGPLVKDTIPYFVDDRNYKGVINYGVEYHSKDYRPFSFFENATMFFITVEIEKCKYNPKDSIISIEGFVSGGWGDQGKNGINEPKNYIEVFVGEKTDTITNCYYNFSMNKDKIETKLKYKNIDKGHILDSFPSFYFKKSSYFRTESKGRRPFKIEAKVDKNTIIAFGASSCYTEIFDIGSMIYSPRRNSKNKIKKKDIKKSIDIIFNNIHLANQEKEKLKPKEINYYTYTETAENHIIRRQFAEAKEVYLNLNKAYKILFARDIHNAMRCAILSRDYENAYYWAEKLAKKGVDIKYFHSKIFNNLTKKKEWQNFSTKYDSISKESQKSQNINLKLQIEQLLEQDQSNYGLANRKDPKILYETTEKVTNKLIELLKKEGFPSEEKIGVYIKNDTTLILSPDYNVIIRHAIQQNPKNLATLIEILDKSHDTLEYDKKRNSNHRGFINSCLQIYKGNLYNNKSCGRNEMMIRKIKFMYNNPNNFIVDYGDFIKSEYNRENAEGLELYYKEDFDFIIKLTDNWEVYEN
jgi:hypothetical protein